ncbi:MAG: DUF2155 domain-containing protein, partial [Alphaproteobacteria bacterium]|nr:DUF2155 domain-containing protein [Alphaproteobacteria bacterium]
MKHLAATLVLALFVGSGTAVFAQSSTPGGQGEQPDAAVPAPQSNVSAPPSETGSAQPQNGASGSGQQTPSVAPGAGTPNPSPPQTAVAAPPVPTGPPPTPPNAVLVMTGLDKITGRPSRILARLNQPVQFATLTITVRTCYSTPPSETPETSAFLQIDDHRPDQPWRRVFSGWMYASSPGLNA